MYSQVSGSKFNIGSGKWMEMLIENSPNDSELLSKRKQNT